MVFLLGWRSIRVKLIAFMVLIALLATGFAMFSSMALTTTFFNQYVYRNRLGRAEQLAEGLALFYHRQGSWEDVAAQFQVHGPSPRSPAVMMSRRTTSERFMLGNENNVIIFDSQGKNLGDSLSRNQINQGVPVMVNEQRVGTVVLASIAVQNNIEQEFFASLQRSTITAGLIVIAVAIIIGTILSQRLINPLVTLSQGADRIARRDLSHRVPVECNDEIGNLARAFNTMAAKLEETEKLRRNMIADLAHELRTPITILRGNLESLQWKIVEPTPELIISLHDEIVRVSRLLTDLQSLAVAEAGELKLNLEPTYLPDMIDQLRIIFTGESANREVDLQVDFEENLPPILADADRLRQVLLNLLSNALEHTPKGGVICLSAKVVQDEMLISIADTGKGIKQNDLPWVFNRFYRGDSRMEGGVGLGLAIVKAYVEAHKGSVAVESTPGKGSTFTIALPIWSDDLDYRH